MSSEILGFMASLITRAEKVNLKLVNEKEINYGVQLQFEKNGEMIPINIYHSKKKGISTVIGGSPKNRLRAIAQGILGKEDEKNSVESHDWKKWAGTDESGKGDFFGALVVCGFIVEKADEVKLRKLGVKDCKLLKDDQLIKIAQALYRDFSKNIEVIMLVPEKYNQLYQKFRNNNKKLNEMLAWMHSRVILDMHGKHNFDGAVVDKFASDKTLVGSLSGMKEMKLLHKIKAEEDIAVAAASIIARYHFLSSIKTISRKFDLDFPKGASKKVITVGKEFAKKYGKERLNEVAKTHFKTLDKI